MDRTDIPMDSLHSPDYWRARAAVNGCEPAGQTVGSTYRRPSLREEAEKNFHSRSELASKAGQAAKFLASYPEFDEFVRLIREGAIQI